jgi:hypothetical protein
LLQIEPGGADVAGMVEFGLRQRARLEGGEEFGADPRWIRMPSGDFEIYSSAGEGDTRLVLQYFERVRAFFEQAFPGSQQKADPVRIIIFNSKKEYEPYRFNEFATAYYTQVAGRDYIVLSGTNTEVFPVAVQQDHVALSFAYERERVSSV